MSYRPKLIPDMVLIALEEHIRNNCKRAETAWEFSNQDEDTITGDFLGNLRTTGWNRVDNYQYRFYYNKARGRGPRALENITGTDGIITIEFQLNEQKRIYKSFVFQAKKRANPVDWIQKNKMDKYFPNANLIFRYSKDSFVVEDFDGTDIKICDFLIDYFFPCNYGKYNLYYDNDRNNYIFNRKEIDYSEPRHKLMLKLRLK